MSHFGFINNDALQKNLEVAFDHILTLIPLSESNNYSDLEKSSFRKTIIIYTASIIEALLFHQICTKCLKDDLKKYSWVLENIKELYLVDKTHKIIAGDYFYKFEPLKLDKINLGIINDLLHDNKYIDKNLFDKVNKVRILRNDQHFGTHLVIKEYSKDDLEFVFSVAKDVKSFVKGL